MDLGLPHSGKIRYSYRFKTEPSHSLTGVKPATRFIMHPDDSIITTIWKKHDLATTIIRIQKPDDHRRSIWPEPGGYITAHTRQVMKDLMAIVNAAGLTAKHVVKCTYLLKDMNDFAAFNAVYGEVLGAVAPAGECVEVTRLP